ncbi:MAG: hypothetical protein CMJ13_03870 [Pelagibacterales bacterium]|nr:hypothetical protein [Pelagibacterales bacterium]
MKISNHNIDNTNPSSLVILDLINHYKLSKYDKAESKALSITKEFPKHQLSWKLLAAVLIKKNKSQEALKANKEALKLNPEDDEVLNNLGLILQKLGKFKEAEVNLKKAISLKPNFSQAYFNLGITLKALGKFEEAEESYKAALKFQPNYIQAFNNLGNLLKETGRLEEAEASFKQAIALKPDYAEAHSNLGVTLQILGRLEEAEASFKEAITLKPDHFEAHSNLGVTLKKKGRLEEAEASYNQAIALKPDYAEALYNRSNLFFDIAKYENALRDADACSLKESKALSLISLYELGRIGEIFKRIEIQSKVDGEDISVAAFAAFISEKEKRPTAYNFCPNPLDFVHVANLSSHVNDSVEYVAEIIEELNEIETIWEPFGKSTVSGFQSLEGLNLFKSTTRKIVQLKSIIISELEAYYLKFKNEPCSYIRKFPSIKNLFGWNVILKKEGHQSTHIHPGGWLSGVIYLKVVPSLGKDEGAIEFSLNGKRYQDINSPSITFQPQVGDIVFFPSSLHHKTIPFTTGIDRIIISFDLLPESTKN